jgi:hypothetical protein
MATLAGARNMSRRAGCCFVVRRYPSRRRKDALFVRLARYLPRKNSSLKRNGRAGWVARPFVVSGYSGRESSMSVSPGSDGARVSVVGEDRPTRDRGREASAAIAGFRRALQPAGIRRRPVRLGRVPRPRAPGADHPRRRPGSVPAPAARNRFRRGACGARARHDVSHTAGLIAGARFQDPLAEGAGRREVFDLQVLRRARRRRDRDPGRECGRASVSGRLPPGLTPTTTPDGCARSAFRRQRCSAQVRPTPMTASRRCAPRCSARTARQRGPEGRPWLHRDASPRYAGRGSARNRDAARARSHLRVGHPGARQ